MYAVIETGGKQYRVEVGTELEVELLDAEPGKTITIDRVLLVADGDESTIGRPLVADASVSAEVVTQTRGPKLISFKYRPKARSRVKKGHRQELTVLRVADITVGGKSAAKAAKKADEAAKTERQRIEDAAVAQAARDAELAAKLAVGSEAPTPAPAKKPAKGKAAAAAEPEEKAEAKADVRPKADAKEPKAKTESKAEAKAKSEVETSAAETAADAGTKAEAADQPEAKAAAPKRASAKSTTDAPEAGASDAEADAPPKRARTTKKDE
jgi:large subunit ribosomal protein L21